MSLMSEVSVAVEFTGKRFILESSLPQSIVGHGLVVTIISFLFSLQIVTSQLEIV